MDLIRLGQGGHLGDPGLQAGVPDPIRRGDGKRRGGCVHLLSLGAVTLPGGGRRSPKNGRAGPPEQTRRRRRGVAGYGRGAGISEVGL